MSNNLEPVEDDDIDADPGANLALWEETLDTLEARCKAASIPFETDKDFEGDEFARISIPNGREKRLVSVFSTEVAQRLLNSQFEKYHFVSRFEAICCYDEGWIEAGLRGITPIPSAVFRKLKSGNPGHGDTEEVIINPLPVLEGYPQIRIGLASDNFLALSPYYGSKRYTLKLSATSVKNNEHAAELLIRFADSIFFQIDLLYGMTFQLQRPRRATPLISPRQTPRGDQPLQYPLHEYNGAAISLYWYARSASGLPLLQYLAFYQCVEFYFPRYSMFDARRQLTSILKHPTFRSDRDDDLDRLISAIVVNRSGSLGDERSQLRAVIQHCISAEDMRSFLTKSKPREEHYSGRSAKQRYHKVPIANKNADLRNDVADRIYDIRCKIVHTKNDTSGGTIEMLLPFSEEVQHLTLDVDLVHFVAQSVLVATSGRIT